MKVVLTADASGAAWAGSAGLVVVVVDVIDFSTSMEAALDEGAAAVFGAGPDGAGPPVEINPYMVGVSAGREAIRRGTGVLLLAEPRAGEDAARRGGVSIVLSGVVSTGAEVEAVVPNLGAETPRLTEMSGRVVLGATGSGGVAFDAALCAGSPAVITGTIARTLKKSGFSSAGDAARRALAEASRLKTGIAVVAAGGNSLEDLLASEYIYKKILEAVR